MRRGKKGKDAEVVKHRLALLLAFTCLSDADSSRWGSIICQVSRRWINSAACWPACIKSRGLADAYTHLCLRSISMRAYEVGCDAFDGSCSLFLWLKVTLQRISKGSGPLISAMVRIKPRKFVCVDEGPVSAIIWLGNPQICWPLEMTSV